MAYATVTVVGNLTRDPELRFTPGGKAVANIGIAENRKSGDNESTHFWTVTCWESLAENVSESLRVGDRVIVWGSPEYRTWEDNDGNKRSVVEFKAEAIGPDLRWASAEVTKNDKPERSNGRPQATASAGARSGGSAERSRQRPAAPPSNDDDFDSEPF